MCVSVCVRVAPPSPRALNGAATPPAPPARAPAAPPPAAAPATPPPSDASDHEPSERSEQNDQSEQSEQNERNEQNEQKERSEQKERKEAPKPAVLETTNNNDEKEPSDKQVEELYDIPAGECNSTYTGILSRNLWVRWIILPVRQLRILPFDFT